MENTLEIYAVVETEEDGQICVTGLPKRWITDGVLYWPNTLNVDRRNPKDPVKGEWSEHLFVMLTDNIGNSLFLHIIISFLQ